MKLGVRWARGTLHLNVSITDPVKKLILMIAEEIKVDPKDLSLFLDEMETKPVDVRGNICNARIGAGQMIYLRVSSELPNVPIAQMTQPIDVQSEYIGEDGKLPAYLNSIRESFGPRTITPAFLEHKESKKPAIIDQEESSCYAIRVGEEAIKSFQNVAFSTNFATHRLTLLFGRIDIVTGKVTVHCSCEPQQINETDKVTIADSFDITVPLAIAKQFDMECVGMAISHRPTDPKYPMTEYMIRLAASFQNMLGEYFTTLIVLPHETSGVQIQAFQVSDSAMKLEDHQLFVDSEDPKHVEFKEEIKVFQKKMKTADVNLLLCAVRVRPFHSKFPSHEFPPPSNCPPVSELKRHFADNEFCPPWRILFDFNLLVYLGSLGVFQIDPDILLIVKAIIKKQEIPSEYMEVINGILNSA